MSAHLDFWRVELRDDQLRRTADITDRLDELRVSLRFNAPSKFTIVAPGEMVDQLTLGQGVIISRHGATLLSGVVWDVEDTDDGDGRDQITVEGWDDLARLGGRLVLPDPTLPPDDDAQPNIQRVSAAAETVIKTYVEGAAGPIAASWPARDVHGGTYTVDPTMPGLTIATDQARGGSIVGRGRYHPLVDYCALMASRGGGLGFHAAQQGTEIVFDVYEPQDRSDTVRISRGLGNLRGWTYRIALPDATVAAAGGRGEGADRLIRTAADGPLVDAYGIRTVWLDQNNAGDADDLTDQQDALDAALDDALADGATEDLTIDAQDTEAVQFWPGGDGPDDRVAYYGLGDQVAVEIRGKKIVRVVEEVELTVDPNAGEMVRPSVGGSAERRWDLYRRLGAVERQVAERGRE